MSLIEQSDRVSLELLVANQLLEGGREKNDSAVKLSMTLCSL